MSRSHLFYSAAIALLSSSICGQVVCAQTAAPAPAPSGVPHLFTVEDIPRLQDVGDPQVSPDGQWVAYTLTTIDTEADKRNTQVWMVSWDGTQDIQLTRGEDSAGSPRWSPDGKYLAFTSGRPGKAKGSQVWVLDRRGGEARPITELKGHLGSYAWSPDAKQLLLTITEDEDDDTPKPGAKPEPRPGDAKPDTARPETKGAAKGDDKPPKPIVVNRYHFKEDVEGYLNDKRSLLYLYTIESKALDKLTTDSAFDEENPVWAPDGKHIAYVSNHDPESDRTINTDVFVVDAVAKSAPKKLTTYNGPDSGPLSWSPDSQIIAYLQGSEPKFEEYDQRQLAVVRADGSAQHVLTAKFDRDTMSPRFGADGQTIEVLVPDDQVEYPAAVSLADGSVKRLLEQPGSVGAHNTGATHTALIWTNDTTPAEVYAFESGALRKLTTHNSAVAASLKLGTTRDIDFKSKDGTAVHGLLTLPPGYEAGKKIPLLLRIHGGPKGQDAHSFSVERQIFAAHGYAVLNVNYRGSEGRGKAYEESIFAKWGHLEVADLLAGVEAAVSEGVADPARLGVGGWSYGGILTDYTIASDTRFKAATSGAGTGNPIALYGVDQYIFQYDNEIGVPWKNEKAYIELGYPLFHADRIHTPTLFMGGDKDFNVPLVGGEQMYQALQSLRVPTELVVYPGQFHGFTRPSFIRDRYQRYLAWYDKYLMPSPPAGK